MADDFRVERAREAGTGGRGPETGSGPRDGLLEVTIHCVQCGAAYHERCDEARAQELLELRPTFTCRACQFEEAEGSGELEEPAWEGLIWSKLTGIRREMAPDGLRGEYACRPCGIYYAEGTEAQGGLTEAQLREELEFGFGKVARERGCAHWPRFLRLRAAPEVATAVRTLAAALADEAAPDPDAGRGRG
jgi:hypothetical protein